MLTLKTRVNCFKCGKSVDKNETYLAQSTDKESRYECYDCFKKARSAKRELFCGRCKYKFQARVPVCPYCSKSDEVIEAGFTIHDLL
ncbi:MAG: hypothetical protein WCV90_06435 [Candidatus Woesearchaeota archaeon]